MAKVKGILTGLAPTDAEIASVEADPSALKTLVASWILRPEYVQKMQTFFELAFQQTQVSATDFSDQTYPRLPVINASNQGPFVQNLRESFARTVLELIHEGRPLTDAFTTQRFMMTPALMEFYAFLDVWQIDDSGKVTDAFKRANPSLTITVGAASGAVPLEQSVDSTNSNYMHFYDPDVANAAATGAGCGQDPIVYPAAADVLHGLLYGSLLGHKSPTGTPCAPLAGTAAASIMAASDFDTWKMVTMRPPASGEAVTPFYDLPSLRTSTELVLSIPRIGFLTPAFFANWQTNTSNQMRVTMNQALIVATGSSVDGSDLTQPPSTPGLDAVHAAQPACFECHQTLDPTRSILSATYSWNYHSQSDPTLAAQKGMFIFRGVMQPVGSVADLAQTLARHPLVAQAWVQKLCYFTNSTACSASDPEFQRIVAAFQSSNFSWSTLVEELLSSPLTTHATSTRQDEVIAVSRRDHWCAALDNRLGLDDVCDLSALTKAAAKTSISQVVSGLPSDGYGRGAPAPVLPNDPTLFFRAGTESVCESIASLVIDSANPPTAQVKQWSSRQSDAAIAEFVSVVMALGAADPRASAAYTLLASHYASAIQAGATATNALKSTFIVACLAPSAVSIGL